MYVGWLEVRMGSDLSVVVAKLWRLLSVWGGDLGTEIRMMKTAFI